MTEAHTDGRMPPATGISPDPRTIEDLRRRACTSVARSLAAAFGGGRPREQFDASMALAESIAERACQFLNSLYLHSARDLGAAAVPDLEQRLLDLGRKNLSFGDFVSSMELFLNKLSPANLHAAVRPTWQEFAASLRDPVDVGEDVAALESIKNAREKYNIPVAFLDQYISDHRGGTPRKPTVANVLKWAATYRNAKAHHHSWFADEEQWYGLLVERWRRILERMVLHPPVYRLLAGLERVATEAVARLAEPGQFLWVATREELDELRRPLGESRLASVAHIGAGRHWALRPDDDRAPLRWMFPSRSFPENVESQEQRQQRYRARVMQEYLKAGTLRSTDVDVTLRPMRGELGIQDGTAQQLEEEVIIAIRAAESDVRSGEDQGAMSRLVALVRHFQAEFQDLRDDIASLDDRRAKNVYDLIEDQWPISHSRLEVDSEVSAEELDRALRRLVDDPARQVRKVETAHGKIHYRIQVLKDTETLAAAIEQVRAQPQWIRGLRPLLEVCQQFFMEGGYAELHHAIGQVLCNDANEESTGVPSLLFASRGQVVKVSTVPDLLREVATRFRNDPALKAKVPFASGRRRNLVAFEARHVAGHPFVMPLQVGDLIFEANQSRFSALKNLRQWFSAASIPVERAEIDGHSIDELGAPGGSVAEAAGTSDELVLHLRFTDRMERVAGGTAGAFLSEVVQLLVEENRLKIDRLPVPIGHVRYLLAQEPKHANGRPFDSPVETEGMFIESAIRRKDARIHAAALCRSVDVDVLDSDLGAETDA